MSQRYREQDLRTKGRYDMLCREQAEEDKPVISISEEAITFIREKG